MWCVDCEAIDKYLFNPTTLWLFLPTQDSRTKIVTWCEQHNDDFTLHDELCIAIGFDDHELAVFLHDFATILTPPELAESKLTTTATSEPPNFEAMSRIVSAETFLARYQSQWLVDSIENERFETWFQPIVKYNHNTDQFDIFAYEGLFRLQEAHGRIVAPRMVFELAKRSKLLYSLDLVARRSAVEHAAKGALQGKLFVNFNPSSIYDPAYCLRSTAAAIQSLGLNPSDIVFEITETDQARDPKHMREILTFYRNAGFGVALDDIGAGWSGLNLLNDVRPDYIKIDMALIHDIHEHKYQQNIVKNLLNIAQSNNITTIAEGVECKEEATWLAIMGADYLQGYYFSRPMPVAPPQEG